MDMEAAHSTHTDVTGLITEACGLVERAAAADTRDPDLETALELVRIDLLAAAFDACDVQATDDACGAVSVLDGALAALRALPEHAAVAARAS